tara:strand:+ start:91 stop:261 length:171 start_codon:yes stop_codon:yes gene_type:complete
MVTFLTKIFPISIALFLVYCGVKMINLDHYYTGLFCIFGGLVLGICVYNFNKSKFL